MDPHHELTPPLPSNFTFNTEPPTAQEATEQWQAQQIILAKNQDSGDEREPDKKRKKNLGGEAVSTEKGAKRAGQNKPRANNKPGRFARERNEPDTDTSMSNEESGNRTIAPLPNRRTSTASLPTETNPNQMENNPNNTGMEDELGAREQGGGQDVDIMSQSSKKTTSSQSTFTPWNALLKSLPTDPEEWPIIPDHDTEPAFQEFNPHLWTTRSGPCPVDLKKFEGPKQMGPLPYVPIPLDVLQINMTKTQIDLINKSIGTRREVIGAIPVGGGYNNNKKSLEEKQAAYNETIRSFQHKHEKMAVMTRAPQVVNEENQSPFNAPWVILVQGLGIDSLKHALHQCYISGPDGTILRIVRFTESDCDEPWTYRNFQPGGLERDQAPFIRDAIVMAAITDRRFQNFALQNAKDLDDNATLEERQQRVLFATSSWAVTVVETGNEKGDFYFQLTGHPLEFGRGSHKVMSDVIRKIKVVYDFFELEDYTGVIACVWCKATTHVSAKCPLPDQPGWTGPTREEMEEMGAPKTKKGGLKSKPPTSKEGPKQGKASGSEKKGIKRKF
ncbi:hypothetical protein PQX77_017628 [Marasmius sp. AFHP31]|nr:hypothetical protein PQX77_017628 [Marasmius sp. AFHP31]